MSILFSLIQRTMGLRVRKEQEVRGLDITEHGLEAYPADAPVKVAAAMGDVS